METSFAAWQDAIGPHLPGAVLAATRSAFLNAARTFYFRTRTWREMLGPFSLRAGRDLIPLNPVDQRADVCFIERAWYYDAPMAVITVASTGGRFPPGGLGTPGGVRLLDPHTCKVEPAPEVDVPQAVRLEVSVQPRLGVDVLPAYAQTHHFEALKVGCLAEMMSQPSKPYTNQAGAILYARRFEALISSTIAMREHGNVQNSVPWSYPNVALR